MKVNIIYDKLCQPLHLYVRKKSSRHGPLNPPAPAPPEGAKHFNRIFNSFSSDFLILKIIPLSLPPPGVRGLNIKMWVMVRGLIL
jgi:hypothetical protein